GVEDSNQLLDYPETLEWIGNTPGYVDTAFHGKVGVNDGDWIITGIQGEHYPCKPDIFEATYEPVEE
ncbi:MAG: hypothetical protein V3W52_14385, partial [Syntrophobacteria bacterium]